MKNLHAGDIVQTYNGAKLVIASIRLDVGQVTVHNFEVADYHTYYVSHARVLVHNNGPCPYNPKRPGRLGSPATQKQISDIATELEGRGYTIEGDGGRAAEEYLRPAAGGRKGGSFVDLTASHPEYGRLRINTVDMTKSGLKTTTRELKNATRIRSQIKPGEHLLLIPK